MADFGNIPFYIEPVFESIFKSFGNSVSLDSEKSVHTEKKVDNASSVSESSEEQAETSLISDLALILVVASITTVIFKRLKQPCAPKLGYKVSYCHLISSFPFGPKRLYMP